jgi:hypothetical protein
MDAPLTLDLLDDPDFPVHEIPDAEVRDMLDDPSHPELEPEHVEDQDDGVNAGPGDTIEDEEWMEQVIDNEPLY